MHGFTYGFAESWSSWFLVVVKGFVLILHIMLWDCCYRQYTDFTRLCITGLCTIHSLALHSFALYGFTLHYITQLCITGLCIILHSFALWPLHYITLHGFTWLCRILELLVVVKGFVLITLYNALLRLYTDFTCITRHYISFALQGFAYHTTQLCSITGLCICITLYTHSSALQGFALQGFALQSFAGLPIAHSSYNLLWLSCDDRWTGAIGIL